jgi:hypothetical protein
MMGLVYLVAALAAGQMVGVEYPPQRRGDVEARLRVDVPEEGAAPGRGRVLVTLTFDGPPGLEVQRPRLEESLAAWRVAGRASSWRQQGERVHYELSLRLEQIKPGQVEPPGIRVGVRTAPATAWQEVAWLELLHEDRNVPEPDMEPPLPASAWPARLRWVALALAGGLLLYFLSRAVRRRLRRERAVPPDVRALARLEALDLPPAERFAQIEGVVRDYLDEQRGLKTRQQTTEEVLAAAGDVPAEAREALRELLERCKLVKFAGLPATPEECEQAVELARRVICACAAVPPRHPAEEGEQGKEVRVT